MKHKLKINVANESPKEGIVVCKKKKVRWGLLRRLFRTEADKVTIIIPGDWVNASPFVKSMKEMLQMPNEKKHSVLVPSSKEKVYCKSFIGNRDFFIENNMKCKKMQIALLTKTYCIIYN